MLFRVSELLVNIGQFLEINDGPTSNRRHHRTLAIANRFTQFGVAWSKSHRLPRPGGRRWVWRWVGAARKRRTCDRAICDSTETISSANRTSQITASSSSGLRGSPVFPCRTPSSRFVRRIKNTSATVSAIASQKPADRDKQRTGLTGDRTGPVRCVSRHIISKPASFTGDVVCGQCRAIGCPRERNKAALKPFHTSTHPVRRTS
jgi:hypothetical protein